MHRRSLVDKLYVLVWTILLAVMLFLGFQSYTANRIYAAETINLVINGQKVSTDVPPMIVNNRTLVPIRVVSESLGAQVLWNAPTRQVTVMMNGFEVVMLVGQKVATVNGFQRNLDVPPTVVSGRTLVPLRFVGEALGAVVAWDESSKTVSVQSSKVSGIRWQNSEDGLTLEIQVSAKVPWKSKLLEQDGGRFQSVIVDLEGASNGMETSNIEVNEGGVTSVRVGLLSSSPPVTRVVVDLASPLEYKITDSQAGVVLKLPPAILGIRHEGGLTYKVLSSGPLDFETLELHDPERLVIDFKGAVVGSGVQPETQGSAWPVRQIRLGTFQASPRVTRVVFDLSTRVGYQVSRDKDGILVAFSSQVNGIKWEMNSVFVQTTGPVKAKSFRLNDPDRIVVDIENATLAEAAKSEMQINGKLLKKIVMAQFQRNPDIVRIVLHVSRPTTYELTTQDTNQGPWGLWVKLDVSPLDGKVIVVDAGHGGSDPGAIGPNGTKEKDVNLGIALALKPLLEDAGAKVIMTRDSDVFVDLSRRSAIANDAGAHLFVSIHANSYAIDSKTGTETYYYNNHPNSQKLAQKILAELVNIGLKDRGTKLEQFIVLREAKMPAVLVEVAFISNPEEEKLLSDKGFQTKVAEAITQGIKRFFEESSY